MLFSRGKNIGKNSLIHFPKIMQLVNGVILGKIISLSFLTCKMWLICFVIYLECCEVGQSNIHSTQWSAEYIGDEAT